MDRWEVSQLQLSVRQDYYAAPRHSVSDLDTTQLLHYTEKSGTFCTDLGNTLMYTYTVQYVS